MCLSGAEERRQKEDPHLSYLFVLFFKGFAIFSIEESGDANNFFFLVHDGKRQDVLDDET